MAYPPIHDVCFLSGATASGKSSIGLELARILDAEIISLDSMSVYREMNIGTAKPTTAELSAVRHHLIDIVSPNENFSLAEYHQLATRAVAEIRMRGKLPLFVGGTPLYMKSLLCGISESPEADWALREQFAEIATTKGSEVLHKQLAEVDPEAADRLHPNDTRRLIRALEVHARSGTPLSSKQNEFDQSKTDSSNRVFVLDWPRDELRRRIDQRVDLMFEVGLVDEVRQIVSRFPQLSRTARQAVGYREVLDVLNGDLELDEARKRMKSRTWRLARKQATWFRSIPECEYVAISNPFGVKPVAASIAAAIRRDRREP